LRSFASPAAGLDLKRFSIPILIVLLACLRFCHVHLLWADEDYHLAAAINLLHGKAPYRDFWYDKPPFAAVFYLLIGGEAGWALRMLDAVFVLTACYLAYRLARDWWGNTEGLLAATFLSFYLAFYLPSAVIPFAADAVMIVPHLAAIYFAHRRSAFWAGVFAGVAFLANIKAVLVLATCLAWLPFEAAMLLAGAALPVISAACIAVLGGVWPDYIEQVWRWGFAYAKGTPVTSPLRTGLVRTLDWSGFHAAAVAGGVVGLAKASRSERWRLGTWLAFSFVGVALGSRFAPHYFLQLLPPLVIAASRGAVLAVRSYGKGAIALFCLLVLIPVVRFGPRYLLLAADNIGGRDPQWSDVVMDLDSRKAGAQVRALARPGDTLFVWGYRPDIYVYTRLVSDSKFWDSQPLTGVPADRHLSETSTVYSGPAALNREQLSHSNPTFIVDGLSQMNPRLAPGAYAELRPWLAKYKLVGRTRLSLIYRRE
jgi:hypothetical protein